MDKELRIIISGGGTGGHIFPAVSIANALRRMHPEAKILFVGAEGRMEMQRVPAAGYEIKGLPIKGFDRRHLLKNVSVLLRLAKSLRMARRIIKEFRPMVAVGVGGYASGATLYECAKMGVPCLIQEQNSYAGVTNKLLAKRVDRICVAYEGMERFFPSDRIIMTGNPVRQNILETPMTAQEARRSFGLDAEKKTVLFVGGSLGARTMNRSVLEHLDVVKAHPEVQLIWQTGKYYYDNIRQELQGREPENLKVMDFIGDMGAAYRAADLVVSRAGASSISEFQLIGKPVILVPSPNVAEDHQRKNAKTLVQHDAALYVEDAEAPEKLLPLALQTVADEAKLRQMGENVSKMGIKDSADIIAKEVLKLINQ